MSSIWSTLILLFILSLLGEIAFGQNFNNHSCRIEFYLLKRVIPNDDSTKDYAKKFTVTVKDLADTAFIKDDEIISYTIHRDSINIEDPRNKYIIKDRQNFAITKSAGEKLKNLKIPLSRGKKFALVINGQICYSGYFWNIISSFGSDWITAFGMGSTIEILRRLPPENYKRDSKDPRKNKLLFDCLKATKRLIEN